MIFLVHADTITTLDYDTYVGRNNEKGAYGQAAAGGEAGSPHDDLCCPNFDKLGHHVNHASHILILMIR
jgi:hypothetical protein